MCVRCRTSVIMCASDDSASDCCDCIGSLALMRNEFNTTLIKYSGPHFEGLLFKKSNNQHIIGATNNNSAHEEDIKHSKTFLSPKIFNTRYRQRVRKFLSVTVKLEVIFYLIPSKNNGVPQFE